MLTPLPFPGMRLERSYTPAPLPPMRVVIALLAERKPSGPFSCPVINTVPVVKCASRVVTFDQLPRPLPLAVAAHSTVVLAAPVSVRTTVFAEPLPSAPKLMLLNGPIDFTFHVVKPFVGDPAAMS